MWCAGYLFPRKKNFLGISFSVVVLTLVDLTKTNLCLFDNFSNCNNNTLKNKTPLRYSITLNTISALSYKKNLKMSLLPNGLFTALSLKAK